MRNPPLFAGEPYFATRMAHVCFHLVRDNNPQSGPNFPALLDHLRSLSRMGYNAVCLELEAMFPYAAAPPLATHLTWTPEQVDTLVALLDELHLEIVPLLQCLGHNYFILEQPHYAPLRELPGYFQQYCPTNPDTRKLYLAMADDILRAFPSIRRFHIGGDECRLMGRCPRCRKFVEQHGMSELYCQHVVQICEALLDRGITPLLWSDMFEHHPETLDRLPRQVQLVYWNYEPADWPRPVRLDLFHQQDFHTLGASAVFYGSRVTDLAGPYDTCLQGIEDLTQILKEEGITEHLVTCWTKGTSWELADWGFFFGAAKSHDPDMDPADIGRRYASFRFGLPDARIIEVHRLLSLPLPFGESIQHCWWERLNRFDHIGRPYQERRAQHGQPENRDPAMAQLHVAQRHAVQALSLLEEVKPGLKRGQRQWDLLENAAREMLVRAQAGEMALLELDHLPAGEEGLGLASRLEGVRHSLKARREAAQETYAGGTPPESVGVLIRLRYPPEEARHLDELSARLTGTPLRADLNPAVIPVLHNPGAPFERGLEHGRVFADLIWDNITGFAGQKYDSEVLASRDRMEAYLFEHFPWMLEEMQGIARGAGLSYENILWLNLFNALVPAEELEPFPGCSTALLCRDHRAGLLKTSDIDPAQRRRMIVQVLDWNGIQAICCGWAGSVWLEFGMNSAGLALGCNSAPRLVTQPVRGIPQHAGGYPLLAACGTVAEATTFLREHPLAGKGLNLGALDAAGHGAIFEVAAHQLQVRPMEGDCIAATNHYLTPDLARLNQTRSAAVLAESRARLQRIESFLSTTALPTVEALKACAAIDTGEGCVCRQGITLAGTVMDSGAGILWLTGESTAEGRWARLDLALWPPR